MRKNKELQLVFVDLKKAHDSVPQLKLLEAMRTSEISAEIIE
jgi:hypothetical protein